MAPPRRTVEVPLGERSYTIEIGAGTLSEAGRFVSSRRKTASAVLITDANVERPHAEFVAESLVVEGLSGDVLVVDPGETSKSIDTAAQIWQQLLEMGVDRQTVIVAVGGGVVGDLAGFVAATYARGLPFVQVPTTLLAQVDSSVGGKVGVNLPGAKNMVGAFWQPCGVLIDTEVLETLPQREYQSGLAEVVKYGVILDEEFFEYLEGHADEIIARRPEVLEHVIARCCELKAQVVTQDEREETGLRAVLNYGHTFAHAFEALTGYERLLHGEAVAMGMLCASRLAERLGRIPASVTRRQRDLLVHLGLEVDPPELSDEEVLTVMSRDKKASQGRLRFVLPTRLGHVELVGEIDPALVKDALRP